MNWTDLLYPVVALISSIGAVLAWTAKLRWAKEYKDATDQLIKAKDAEAAALKAELALVQSLSSGKILEHAATTKQGLEEIIGKNEDDLESARTTIDGLRLEIANLKAITAGSATSGTDATTNSRSVANDTELAERAEVLESQLHRAQIEERRLRIQQLTLRTLKLDTAPALEHRYAVELASIRAQRSEVNRALDEAKSTWLRDRQDAETKLMMYRDRGFELQEQLRQIDALGPEGICPTCGRSVGSEYERLSVELQDQWAIVIQDGHWWSSRVDQLKVKPEEIVTLERRLEELSRQVEDRTQKLTRCEAAVQELRSVQAELKELQDLEVINPMQHG